MGTARQEAPFVKTRTVIGVLAGDVIWGMSHGLWESWLGSLVSLDGGVVGRG